MIITLNGREYKINTDKAAYFLSRLEDRKVNADERELRDLMKKYKLYDAKFLTNMK